VDDDDAYSIASRREGADTVRLVLVGEFDLRNAQELAAALTTAVRTPGVARIVVDLGGTAFLDSSGIAAVAAAYEIALDTGRQLRLENPQRQVRRLFEILEMTVLFE
jgi:anti-sigma B factor antagonist